MGRIRTTRIAFKSAGLEFAPGWVPTIAVLLLLPVLIRLGMWQLERAAEKRSLLALYEQRALAPPAMIDAAGDDAEALRYRQVVVKGRYDPGHHILLDNRVHHGVAGYHVLTPLALGDGAAVLVNRGWIPLGESRSRLPRFDTPAGAVTVRGTVRLPPESVFDLAPGEAYAPGWPKVAQHVRPEELGPLMNLRLLPFVVQLDAGEPDGFIRNWQHMTFSPDKHTSYAVQWFALAAVLVVLYIVLGTRRLRRDV